jgi:hypothetical protein
MYNCQHCVVLYIAMNSIKLNVNSVVLYVAGLIGVDIAVVYLSLWEIFHI